MTLSEFMRFNARVGNHWFSEGTMAFFRSRIEAWDDETGYFISSEVGPTDDCPRAYTLRKADFKTGRVQTISEFGEFETLREAKRSLGSKIL